MYLWGAGALRNPSQIFHCHVLKKKHLAHFTLAVDILKYHPGAEGTNYIQHFTTLDLIGQIWPKDYAEITTASR